ncbi:MAG TPA: hypothetical protein DCQ34_07645 [Chitinophagaceae bacterium]|nr:hypothetical protein [Chitinophagaceae bacterium]HCY89050.1 hypothetical protein [Chitinophagaceae bacterium]
MRISGVQNYLYFSSPFVKPKSTHMKKITTCLAIALFVSITGIQAQTEEENKKWMEYATPAGMQKMMASWDGNWDEEIKMWMAPGAPEQTMKASCTNRMILGGRYQESTHKGDFMGMPFEGIGTLGWDNAGKFFVNTWIDNFGTGMMISTGTWDEKTQTINLKGSMTDPMTGKPVQIRETLRIVNDDTQIMEQFTMKDGQEFKNMEIKMTRRK